MYRSVTLSEIVSSTFTNNLEEDNTEIKKYKFRCKLGIGLAEVLVSSLNHCYGIILAQNVDIGIYPLETAVWTPIIFLAAWHLTVPWSQFSLRNIDKKPPFYYKLIISISTICLSVGIVLPPHYICYGIFGGVFSSIIYTYLRHIERAIFKCKEYTFQANIQPARAVGLLLLSHLMLLLVLNFTLEHVTMIYAAIVINVIPMILIIKIPTSNFNELIPSEASRYHTLPAFSQQVKEMKVFSTTNTTSDMSYNNLLSYDFPTMDDDYEDDPLVYAEPAYHPEYSVENSSLVSVGLGPNTIQKYYSEAGVSILPEIVEEEEEENEKNELSNFKELNINTIDPKRLSRISAYLEELNNPEPKEPVQEVVSQIFCANPEPIRSIEYIANYDQKKSYIHDINLQKRSKCSPYTIFLWKRRLRRSKDFTLDYILFPIYRSLKNLHFYPILFSKVLIGATSMLFISLVPYLALQKNDKYTKGDMAFLLSYIAFSWCLSLMTVPLIMTFTTLKLRMSFVAGLILNSCSILFLMKQKMTNDFITWSCFFFGFGHGLTKYTEGLVYRTFAGKRKYRQFEGTLNILTGFFVILVYYFVYVNKVDLVTWFPLAAASCYAVTTAVWIVAPVLKEIIIFLIKYFRNSKNGNSIYEI